MVLVVSMGTTRGVPTLSHTPHGHPLRHTVAREVARSSTNPAAPPRAAVLHPSPHSIPISPKVMENQFRHHHGLRRPLVVHQIRSSFPDSPVAAHPDRPQVPLQGKATSPPPCHSGRASSPYDYRTNRRVRLGQSGALGHIGNLQKTTKIATGRVRKPAAPGRVFHSEWIVPVESNECVSGGGLAQPREESLAAWRITARSRASRSPRRERACVFPLRRASRYSRNPASCGLFSCMRW